MDDLISKEQAIDKITKRLLETAFNNVGIKQNVDETLVDVAENRLGNWFDELPSAEPCGDAVSRNGIVQKLNKMDRYVSAELRLCDTDKIFPQNEVFIVDDVYEEIVEQLPSAQPPSAQPKRGKWILNRSGAYCCDKCMEPCASYVMMRPRDKFCKMCGSRNEVME